MTSATAAREAHGGVARLVEAERRWESALADARRRAASIVSDAESAAAAATAQAHTDLGTTVEARRRELEASLAGCAQAARDELAARTRRYTDADDATVARIAAGIVERAPWFAQPEAR
ncbi:MAG TPA: hypothetical protein VHB25_01390 [Gemmatimonadaceae bacterium]|nr:hypothetical protein [Gemmatimonadaceae bacterium]